ncbi:alkylhydroperoxidase AhpD family core domain-containing protein [Variovorax sp. OK605]|jgi:AhpD family alkylhydroperoxidase|uniref:carboxymuconolactone decarboxylase family protein n=1 Tax=unclassified Variovorax TaxID=663243 RepID=UPI0008B11E64|nr:MULTISPECIES: carboxymuconolactone decarboxylase family protein [unclassified Variovorax]SEJ97029.1 alkylhydroperoxidase AhpD family core domain-containing protein [Variovorax sp. OK202]SFD21994.1 alkylhydroperoxidase AhpD family core domain-containing protein [Variovorax sp. OK212]SFP47242.1 alkylhydroperoxidase AhpD family core domain-containing protein [Variovorax sp. OK605]
MNTTARLNWFKLVPKSFEALLSLNTTLEPSTLGKVLVDYVFARVSQINGCAYCLDMHVRDLRAQGEEWQRINSLPTWREVSFFNARERAALAWAESLTRLADSHDEREAEFAALKANFSDVEIAELSVAVAQINAWNRLNVGMRLPVPVKPLA